MSKKPKIFFKNVCNFLSCLLQSPRIRPSNLGRLHKPAYATLCFNKVRPLIKQFPFFLSLSLSLSLSLTYTRFPSWNAAWRRGPSSSSRQVQKSRLEGHHQKQLANLFQNYLENFLLDMNTVTQILLQSTSTRAVNIFILVYMLTSLHELCFCAVIITQPYSSYGLCTRNR